MANHKDVEEYHAAMQAYDKDPSLKNLKRLNAATETYREATWERLQARYAEMSDIEKSAEKELRDVEKVKKPETKLERVKTLLTKRYKAYENTKQLNKYAREVRDWTATMKKKQREDIDRLKAMKKELMGDE